MEASKSDSSRIMPTIKIVFRMKQVCEKLTNPPKNAAIFAYEIPLLKSVRIASSGIKGLSMGKYSNILTRKLVLS